MLSKKYYINFANILGQSRSVGDVVTRISDYFKEDNPRFDRAKFESAVMRMKEASGI